MVREAKSNSVAAQQCLFNSLYDRMYLLCRRFVKVQEDAEEMVLNGFYKFFVNISSFSYINEEGLFSYIRRYMINECLMHLRKKNAFHIVSEPAEGDAILEDSVIEKMAASEILNCILQLPVGYRTIFNLYVIEGMDHPEIASALGITTGTSKSQLSKAKNLLQKILSSKGIIYERNKSNG